MYCRRLLFAALLSVVALAATAGPAPAQITTRRVASGLSWPIWATAPAGDARLFIVEQGGRIRILKDGAVLATPFLDVSALVTPGLSQFSEQGLLGLAFHPQYAANGFFYINYTDNGGDTVVARYRAQAGNPDRADAASAAVVIAIPQPYANHNGGTLAFGPQDGYLYVGMGDGGSGGDPQNRAQNDGLFLGKLLRLDVDSASPYAIPPTNPFVGTGLPLDEIWAKGLRNPYRFSFDPLNGDLYIGDVGQDDWEEIDWQPGGAAGGANYGWRLMEGSHCYNPATGCNPGGLTLPVHEYSHATGCSVTGGAVYRGAAIPALQGTYFFADYCTPTLWSFKMAGGAATELTTWPAAVVPGDGEATVGSIAAIAPGGDGELYIVDRASGQEGEVWKIVPTTTSPVQRGSLGGLKAQYRR